VFAVPTGDLTQDERGHAIPATNRIKVMATLKVKPLTFAHSKIQRPPGMDEQQCCSSMPGASAMATQQLAAKLGEGNLERSTRVL
jgi:hypothetical protein